MLKSHFSGRIVGIALFVSLLLVAVLAIGCTGPTGPAGAPGPPGNPGPAGATGPQGPQGVQGVSGAQGLAGPAGAAGKVGPTGPIGPAGPAGLTGLPGAPGATGPAGATGAQGPAAAQPMADITVSVSVVGTTAAYSVFGAGFASGENVNVVLIKAGAGGADIGLGSTAANASGAFELPVDNAKLAGLGAAIYGVKATGDKGSAASAALKIK